MDGWIEAIRFQFIKVVQGYKVKQFKETKF
jgi:hypothetical protein